MLSSHKQIGNIDWVSSELFLLDPNGRILIINEILESNLWVGADALALSRIPPSLHGEQYTCVMAIQVVVV